MSASSAAHCHQSLAQCARSRPHVHWAFVGAVTITAEAARYCPYSRKFWSIAQNTKINGDVRSPVSSTTASMRGTADVHWSPIPHPRPDTSSRSSESVHCRRRAGVERRGLVSSRHRWWSVAEALLMRAILLSMIFVLRTCFSSANIREGWNVGTHIHQHFFCYAILEHALTLLSFVALWKKPPKRCFPFWHNESPVHYREFWLFCYK